MPFVILSLSVVAPVIVITSVIIAALTLVVTPGSVTTGKRAVSVIKIFLLNLLPVAYIMPWVFFLSGSVSVAIVLTAFFILALSVVNRYKIKLRGEPLNRHDFLLAPELAGVFNGFGVRFILVLIVAVILIIAAAAFVIGVVTTMAVPIAVRVVGCVVLTAGAVPAVKWVYAGNEESDDAPGDAPCTVSDAQYAADYAPCAASDTPCAASDEFCAALGFIYWFMRDWQTAAVKPELDKQSAERYVGGYAQPCTAPDVKPDIVMIVCESFSELSESGVFNFDGHADPLINYKNIKDASVAGSIVVPRYGGGTSDTEFDLLAAGSARFLRDAPYAFRLVKNCIDGLPHWLKARGYRAEAIHPGHAWYYNRRRAFNYLGFDAFCHLKNFTDPEMNAAGFATDKTCFDKIIERYEAADSAPLFLYALTIEGHGPYGSGDEAITFDTNADMPPQYKKTLGDYFEKIQSADAQLKRITDYFDMQTRPTVLIIIGDHMPGLPPPVLRRALGESERDPLAAYTLPYLVWRNAAAGGAAALNERNGVSINIGRMSSFYLTPFIMELIGYNGGAPVINFLNTLRIKYPVVTETQCYDSAGAAFPLSSSEELRAYRDWTIHLTHIIK